MPDKGLIALDEMEVLALPFHQEHNHLQAEILTAIAPDGT
jgi:hypothetical protein